MSPIEFASFHEIITVGFSLILLGFISLLVALYGQMMNTKALKERVTTLEELLAKLVANRVDEVTTQSCRSLNEVGS